MAEETKPVRISVGPGYVEVPSATVVLNPGREGYAQHAYYVWDEEAGQNATLQEAMDGQRVGHLMLYLSDRPDLENAASHGQIGVAGPLDKADLQQQAVDLEERADKHIVGTHAVDGIKYHVAWQRIGGSLPKGTLYDKVALSDSEFIMDIGYAPVGSAAPGSRPVPYRRPAAPYGLPREAVILNEEDLDEVGPDPVPHICWLIRLGDDAGIDSTPGDKRIGPLMAFLGYDKELSWSEVQRMGGLAQECVKQTMPVTESGSYRFAHCPASRGGSVELTQAFYVNLRG